MQSPDSVMGVPELGSVVGVPESGGGLERWIKIKVCAYYSWMNRKARAEGCKWKGYLCYEAGKSATCVTECPPQC